ncbi:PilZ domain-containing protein [Sphingomonas sp. LHG3406-1]|uniref:PilZ domain-containing protein n=1 Tax=Sphingomonas sp. LHG3406-1 TaxID=2804617 RepID=UPI00261CEAC7|nr:PilZ domain-containing protein [Sphingomonas sp. LHG3406-1]
MTPALPASAEPDPYADRRLHPRVAVAMPAFLILGGRRYPVQIVDLSAGGAKIDCGTALVAAGAPVTLNWGGGSAQATVRWREGRLAGIAFAAPLDERDVAALATRSAALAARMNG